MATTNTGELRVLLKVVKGQFGAELKSAEKQVSNAGKEMMGTLGKLGIAFLGVQQAVSSWNAMLAEDRARLRAINQLKLVGEYSEGTAAQLDRMANEFERVGIAEEVSFAAFAKFITATRDSKLSLEQLNITAKFAAYWGLELTTIADATAKAYGGQTMMLRRYLSELGISLGEGAKFVDYLNAMKGATGEVTDAMSDAERQTIELKKAWADLQEEGARLAAPVVTTAIRGWALGLESFRRQLEDLVASKSWGQFWRSYQLWVGGPALREWDWDNEEIDRVYGKVKRPPDKKNLSAGDKWTDPASGNIYEVQTDGSRKLVFKSWIIPETEARGAIPSGYVRDADGRLRRKTESEIGEEKTRRAAIIKERDAANAKILELERTLTDDIKKLTMDRYEYEAEKINEQADAYKEMVKGKTANEEEFNEKIDQWRETQLNAIKVQRQKPEELMSLAELRAVGFRSAEEIKIERQKELGLDAIYYLDAFDAVTETVKIMANVTAEGIGDIMSLAGFSINSLGDNILAYISQIIAELVKARILASWFELYTVAQEPSWLYETEEGFMGPRRFGGWSDTPWQYRKLGPDEPRPPGMGGGTQGIRWPSMPEPPAGTQGFGGSVIVRLQGDVAKFLRVVRKDETYPEFAEQTVGVGIHRSMATGR